MPTNEPPAEPNHDGDGRPMNSTIRGLRHVKHTGPRKGWCRQRSWLPTVHKETAPLLLCARTQETILPSVSWMHKWLRRDCLRKSFFGQGLDLERSFIHKPDGLFRFAGKMQVLPKEQHLDPADGVAKARPIGHSQHPVLAFTHRLGSFKETERSFWPVAPCGVSHQTPLRGQFGTSKIDSGSD